MRRAIITACYFTAYTIGYAASIILEAIPYAIFMGVVLIICW